MEWRDIESAPAGGEFENSITFLAYSKDGGVFPCQRRGDVYYDLESVDRDGDWWDVNPPPTHWMPLPEPPHD